MAYSLEQQAIIARELASSGGNLTIATEILRRDYDGFKHLNRKTIRHLLKIPEFIELLDFHKKATLQAFAEESKTLARLNDRRFDEGAAAGFAEDNEMLFEARTRLRQILCNEKLAPALVLRAYNSLARVDHRNQYGLAPLGQSQELSVLTDACREVLLRAMSPLRACRLLREILETGQKKLNDKEQEVADALAVIRDEKENPGAVLKGVKEAIETAAQHQSAAEWVAGVPLRVPGTENCPGMGGNVPPVEPQESPV